MDHEGSDIGDVLPSNVRQLEIDFVADVLHCRQDHVMETVSRIRALRHDEGLQRHPPGAVRCVVLVVDVDGDEGHAEDHEEKQQACDAEDDPLVPSSRCRS